MDLKSGFQSMKVSSAVKNVLTGVQRSFIRIFKQLARLAETGRKLIAPSKGQVSAGSPRIKSRDLLSGLGSLIVLIMKRLRHNLGITISGVIGIIAVLAMVVCVPVFSHAVSGQILRGQLQEKSANNHRGLFSVHQYVIDQTSASPLTIDVIDRVTSYIRHETPIRIGTEVEELIVEMQTISVNWKPEKIQYTISDDEPWMNFGFFTLDDLQKHAKIVEGAWPEISTDPGKPIQVAVHQNAADLSLLNVGDIYRYKQFKVQITGLWAPVESTESYWFQMPNSAYNNMMWVPKDTYVNLLSKVFARPIFYASWYTRMREKSIKFNEAQRYLLGMTRMDLALKQQVPNLKTDYSPAEELGQYQERAESLTTLFYAVGGPMVILALLFISLTANIAVQQYEQETATLRGRGTSWLQVSALNLMESLILLAIAIIPSLLVGWVAALLMGQTLSFLKFASRPSIPFSLDGLNPLWLVIASSVIVISRFLPMLQVSRTTIVRMKQSRDAAKPLWQRFFLDFFILIPGIYAYMTMSGLAEKTQFLERVQAPPSGQYRDILLYVAPSLFAMALCMILIRIIPVLLRLIARIVEHFPQVWLYLSVQQIARRPQDHSSAVLLIMISLSLAIYSASMAKTLDRWLHDSLYYKSGSDLAVHEYAVVGGGPSGMPGGQSAPTQLQELDFSVDAFFNIEEHRNLPSVEGVTRVGKYPGKFSFGVGELNCNFMGIDRIDFPKVAFFRDDFSDESFGALMNQLGSTLDAVLIPRSVAAEKGLRIGDQIDTTVMVSEEPINKSFTVTGIFDYFPTVYPSVTPTLIVNFGGIFDNPDAVVGYDLWIKLNEDADTDLVIKQVTKIVGGNRAVVEVLGDAKRELKKQTDEPERMGLFGILNVGFLMTGLMPGIGFILYSYASLRRRFIQLGILQAIGISVKQLIGYLVSEQVILMGIAIFGGLGIGLVASHLFVPFLQVNSTSGLPIPPFEVRIGWTESIVISLVFFLVLVATMIGTISSLVRMKVFQAVKMGETL